MSLTDPIWNECDIPLTNLAPDEYQLSLAESLDGMLGLVFLLFLLCFCFKFLVRDAVLQCAEIMTTSMNESDILKEETGVKIIILVHGCHYFFLQFCPIVELRSCGNAFYTLKMCHIFSKLSCFRTVLAVDDDVEMSTVCAAREFAKKHRRAFATRCQVQPASHQVGILARACVCVCVCVCALVCER